MIPEPDREHDPRLAAIYRAGADAAPPAHLDDAIRAAARREVAAGPRRTGMRRWTMPVSLAAVVVLSVTVVTLMREQGVDRPESMMPPPAQTPAARMQSGIVQNETVKKESAGPATAITQEAAKPRPATPPPAAAVPSVQTEAPASAMSTLSGIEAGRGVVDPGAKTMAAESPRRAEEPVAMRRDHAPQPMLRSAPAPMADVAGGASAARPAAPAALAAGPAKSALWQDLVREPPEKWLQRIVELRRSGNIVDADALMIEFRRRFPDEQLPENLR